MSGKASNKTKKTTLIWIITVSFAIVIVFYLVHDVKLEEEIVKLGKTDVPEIRLENIKFERNIFDSLWKIHIPTIERIKEVAKILSIDISRELINGDIWTIKGNDGVYIESTETAVFNDIIGKIVWDGQVFEVYAPSITWEKSGDLVLLTKGIVINGEYGSLSADKAIVETGNMVTLEGGEIIWNFTSYDQR